MRVQRIKQKTAAVLASAIVMAGLGGVTGVSSASAQAAECHQNSVQNNSDQVLRMKGNYNLKNGIGSVCGNITLLSEGTIFYVWCFVLNPDSGKVWNYGRVKGTQTKGWISNDNATHVSGTANWC
ncbi:hypothetical protein AB0K21_09490 [Streptosporangium sp. NPDC049248]|uniref:hypothetical protein n=1 Tax=Streptosporangium sp. NPDC049248 TaxID=3155651 RepID=UPI003445AB85